MTFPWLLRFDMPHIVDFHWVQSYPSWHFWPRLLLTLIFVPPQVPFCCCALSCNIGWCLFSSLPLLSHLRALLSLVFILILLSIALLCPLLSYIWCLFPWLLRSHLRVLIFVPFELRSHMRPRLLFALIFVPLAAALSLGARCFSKFFRRHPPSYFEHIS